MEFKDGLNYIILSSNNDKNFISNFSMYPIINLKDYESLKETLEMFPSKKVVFNETLSSLKMEEKINIIKLLNKQKINYINITSNIEDFLLADYMLVYDNDKVILKGDTKEVLKHEKTLKKAGFDLPFTVDLSSNLMYYDILDCPYYDMDTLLEALWN